MARKGETKTMIVEKALELFSEKGFEGAALDELARACGITKPAIYYYFRDKAALYEAVVCSQFTVLEEKIAQETAEGSAVERLRSYIRTFGTFLIDNPHFSAIFSREITAGAGTLPESCAQRMAGILRTLISILDAGRQEGVFREENPFMVQMTIVTPLTAYHVSRPLRERIARELGESRIQKEVEFHDVVDRLAERIVKGLTC